MTATTKNLGSAKTGTGHYMLQKASTVALLLLFVALAFSLGEVWASGFSFDSVRAFVQVPANAVILVLTIVALCIHFAGHVREVVEDYIHHEGLKLAILLIVQLAAIVAAVSMIYSIILMSILGGVQ